MNRIIHFEIHAADPERAAKFYNELFGWDIQEWKIPGVEMARENRYWMVTIGARDEPGINGGILFRRGPAPVDGQGMNAYVCTIGVESLDEHVARAQALGATLTMPRMPIKGVGWLAYCKDIDGNYFGMLQEDSDAE